MNIEKISFFLTQADEATQSSLKIIIHKINEIVDILNEKEKDCYCSYGYSCKNCCEKQEEEKISSKLAQYFKTPAPWKPEKGEEYFYISDWGNILHSSNNKSEFYEHFDIYRFNSGNCFRTRGEAENKLKDILNENKKDCLVTNCDSRCPMNLIIRRKSLMIK